MTPFQQLGLSDEVLRVIDELGFEEPTNIQRKAIPYLLSGDRDFIGLAQTGTGKTAAFGLPLLEQIDTSVRHTQALVLSPTRELGQQIAEQLHTFSKYKGKLNVVAVYGGASIVPQMKALKQSPHVIIATPGRLIDLINRRAARLDQLRYLVLDEADELMNMGFQDELDTILDSTPDSKQTWLFSATMPKEIRRMVHKYMEDPYEVKVNTTNEVNVNIEHQFTVLRPSDKTEALMRFLDADPGIRAVVFCRTKRETQALAEELLRREYKADALHGDLSQAQRDRVMKRFKSHDLKVLIATDVAARGIDVNDLTHVFHHTLPDENAYYTHRSGRTARAGKKGISLSFITGRDVHRIRRLEKELGIEFSKTLIPEVSDIIEQRINSWSENILNTATKGRISQELADRVETIFGNLSKEEIIAKFLVAELNKIDLSVSKDLNDRNPFSGGGGGGRGRGRGRGGSGRSSGRGGGSRYGKRTRGAGGNRRSGGRSSDRTSDGGSSSSRDKSGGFKKKKRRKK